MSLAEETRDAVRERPFLREALRAGVVNYTAAARFLAADVDAATGVDGVEAIATALRRYQESLSEYEETARDARVVMQSRLGAAESDASAVLAVGDAAFAPDVGSLTGVVATGDFDVVTLAGVLGRLRTAGVDPVAAGATDGSLVVVVERLDGPDALRAVESVLDNDATPRE